MIDRVVELLDLEELVGEYAEEGKPAYHPKMMLKVLFYSYYAGLMSCRKMWDGLKHRADFIFLSGDQVPEFRTLNAFRSRHIKILPKLFVQIVLLCVKVGMLDFKHLAIDGQRIQGNASYRRSKTRKRVKKAYERVREGIADVLEKEPNEEFTEEKKRERLKRLGRQEKQLLGLKRVLEGLADEEATINMTDPEDPVSEAQGRKEAAELQSSERNGGEIRAGVCRGHAG